MHSYECVSCATHLLAFSSCVRGLRLTGRVLYDLTGNHFDEDALVLKVFPLIWDWARGADLPAPPRPLHQQQHDRIFQAVRERTERLFAHLLLQA